MRATKDSGVDWLGEIPVDWDVKPCWSYFRRVKQTGFPEEELLSVYRDHGVVPKSSRDDNHNVESEDLSAYQLVRIGDMVMNKMKAWQGSIALSDHRGIVSPAYFVYQPTREFNRKYFHYLMRSAPYIAEYNRISKGVRIGQWDLDPTYFRTTSLIVPSVDEQRRIADFLDRETAKIDTLIAKQEKLISAIGERINATVSVAVERGEINDGSPIRGVNFNRWRRSKLRHQVSLNPSPRSLSESELSREVNFLPMSAIGDEGELDLERLEVASELTGSYSFFEDGDVLMAKVTPCFENGKGAVASGTVFGFGFATTEVTVLRPKRDLLAEFLYYLLHTSTFLNLGSSEMTGAGGLKRVPDSFVRDYWFLLPPLEEQKEIVLYLEQQLGELRKLQTKSSKLIQVIKERRQALISAAVTGKLEVTDGYS